MNTIMEPGMANSFIGVSRIVEIANIDTNIVPSGWVVKERYNQEGKPISLDYGCYVKNDVFVSVPIHFSLKSKLILMSDNGTEKYYALPKDMQLSVSKYTNKKGKECPILVPVSEKFPAYFIACLGVDCIANDKILNIFTDNDIKVIRKYIDKDRKCIGLIVMHENNGVINPEISLTVVKGVVGSHKYTRRTYNMSYASVTTHTDSMESKDALKTSFIDLPNFIEVKPVNNKTEEKK